MIRDLHQKLINGETTSVKLTEEYFAEIEKKEPTIDAYLTLTKELAMRQAEDADARIKRGEKIGMLTGIPGGIKDLICVLGERCTGGSKILDSYIAPHDATVVKRLKEAGAVFLGKTNCDEFAMGSSTENSAYKITKNPLDTARVPGGTSGGSAAAIAAGEAVWTLGTDTGGSSRQPAAFCGVVGLKPTYGRVSRYGVMAAASSLEQVGIITKTVEDAAIVLSSIAGQDKMDATTAESGNKTYEDYLTGDISGKKIGIPKEYMEGLDGEIRKLFDQAVEKFKSLGAIIEIISLPHAEYALPTYYIINFSEISSNLARYDGIKYGLRVNDREKSGNADLAAGREKSVNADLAASDEDSVQPMTLLETYLDTRKIGLGAEAKRRIMLGTYALSAGYYDAYYLKAQKVRNLIKEDFKKVFDLASGGVDFIFSPTAPEAAFKIGEKSEDPMKMYLSDIYTITANLAGVPAISFPIGDIEMGESSASRRMPIGGQLMGKWFDEEGLLNVAHTFEIN